MQVPQFQLPEEQVRSRRPENLDITEHHAISLWENPLFQLVYSESARLADKARFSDPRGKSPEKFRDDVLVAEGMEKVWKLFDDALGAISSQGKKNKGGEPE